MKVITLSLLFIFPPVLAALQNLNGPMIEPTTKKIDTPLHIATKQHNFTLVQSLVEANADVDEINYDGLSALDIARDCCYSEKENYLKNIEIYLYLFQSRFDILQVTFDSLSLCDEDDCEVIDILPCAECEDCEYCEEDGK